MCKKSIHLLSFILALVVGPSATHGQGYLTEEFLGDAHGDGFDLAYSSITFTPTSNGTSYVTSLQNITQLPRNPALGTDLGLGDDDYEEVGFSDPVSVRIFNRSFSSFFVGSNGYITFTRGDQDPSQTLEEHFETLRISGLFCDLAPPHAGSVKAQYCANCVAITWLEVPEYSYTATNTFQIEMFFDGRIRISWLEINADECIVGLSKGLGLPDGFVETDFTDAGRLLQASAPSPADGARHFDTWVTLSWKPGDTAVSHDVYVGNSYSSVYNGTLGTSTYRGSYIRPMVTLGFPGGPYPEGLVPGTTYYWRIDEVEANGATHRGSVWNFSTEDYVSVPILDEELTLDYDTELVLDTPADLTVGGLASDLALRFQGDPSGTAEPIYVRLEDSTGATFTVIHPNPAASQIADRVVWRILLSEFTSVNLTRARKIYIGAGYGEPGGGDGKMLIIHCKSDIGAQLATLNIYVKDPDGQGIQGATVSVVSVIEQDDDCSPDYPTYSSGWCMVKPHMFTTYTITVTKDGYSRYSASYYIDEIAVQRLDITLTPEEQQDQPTEEFKGDAHDDGFDLAYSSITFTPTSEGTSYVTSLEQITELPRNPALGTDLGLGDDDYVEVGFSDPVSVKIFNRSFSSFFVGSNGYITFTRGDQDPSQTLEEHFETLRISGLFCDLAPPYAGSVKGQYYSSCVAITWLEVPEYSYTATNTFQIEMFFDGRIRISWLEINADECIVGLSKGLGLPDGFVETDFSARYAIP